MLNFQLKCEILSNIFFDSNQLISLLAEKSNPQLYTFYISIRTRNKKFLSNLQIHIVTNLTVLYVFCKRKIKIKISILTKNILNAAHLFIQFGMNFISIQYHQCWIYSLPNIFNVLQDNVRYFKSTSVNTKRF